MRTSGSNPALVISGGDLSSLDMSVTGTLTVAGVTIAANALEITYVSATQDLGMSGTTSLSFNVGSNAESVAVTLGTSGSTRPGYQRRRPAEPGYEAVTGTLTVAGVTIAANALEITYIVSATQDLGMSGTTSLSFNVGSNAESVAVTLGTSAQPGLVINSGSLQSLDMSVTGTLTVAGVTIAANALEITYVSATQDLGMSGTTSLSFNVGSNAESVAVTLGTSAQPGLVINSGSLQSLDMSVTEHPHGGGKRDDRGQRFGDHLP